MALISLILERFRSSSCQIIFFLDGIISFSYRCLLLPLSVKQIGTQKSYEESFQTNHFSIENIKKMGIQNRAHINHGILIIYYVYTLGYLSNLHHLSQPQYKQKQLKHIFLLSNSHYCSPMVSQVLKEPHRLSLALKPQFNNWMVDHIQVLQLQLHIIRKVCFPKNKLAADQQFKQVLTKAYSPHDFRSVGISNKSEVNTAKIPQCTLF